MAHRRFASESAAVDPSRARRARPLSILSPPSSPAVKDFNQVPAVFEDVVHDLEAKKRKTYCEGYILKYDDLNSEGGRPKGQTETWQEVYASLSGNVLSTWPSRELLRAEGQGVIAQVPPTFINVTDARIMRPVDTSSKDIIISTAGKNRYLLRAPEDPEQDLSRRWLMALRLAMFERARAQEVYTASLFHKYQSKETSDVSAKEEKWAGQVEVRLSGSDHSQTSWKTMWCTVHSSVRTGLFKRTQTKPGASGQEIRFYSNKKDKSPFVVMTSVYAAYAVFPEHIALIESAGLIKVEAQLPYRTLMGLNNADGFALIIPAQPEVSRRLSIGSGHTPSSAPLVHTVLRLLSAIYSAFELYNRPRDLMLSVDHVNSLGTAGGLIDLQLDILLGIMPRGLSDESSWRRAFREQSVLQSHYTSVRGKPMSPAPSPVFQTGYNQMSQPRRTGNERRVVSEGSIMPRPRALVTSIEEDEEQEDTTTGFWAGQTPRPVQSEKWSSAKNFNPASRENPYGSSQAAAPPIDLQPVTRSPIPYPIYNGNHVSVHMPTNHDMDRTPKAPQNSIFAQHANFMRQSANPSRIDTSHRSVTSSPPSATSTTAVVSDVSPQPQFQRQISYNSVSSGQSGSVYSGTLDESVLDMVQEFHAPSSTYLHDGAQSSQTSFGNADSIYSEKSDAESDYASTLGDHDQPKGRPSVQELVSNRAGAIEALEITRRSEFTQGRTGREDAAPASFTRGSARPSRLD